MYVLNVDQHRSRLGNDLVPSLLDSVNHDLGDALVLPFERTAGDEAQGLIHDAGRVVDLVVDLIRSTQWWIGVGIGEADTPYPDSVREGRGTAFVRARSAVEQAKSSPQPVCVSGAGNEAAGRAESACWLLAGLLRRRSREGWQAVDAMTVYQHQKRAAEHLDITPQAMSRRLRVAGWTEEMRGRSLAEHLLQEAE